ncbi:MAG: DUF4255 domain-containing protein [Methanosarcinaceae archaeon]
MSDCRAIADVGRTLIELLRAEMGYTDEEESQDNRSKPVNVKSIVLASPGEIDSNDDVRLSLFLYQVLENAYLKNQDIQIAGPTKLKPPPQALELYYMLTSYAAFGNDKTDKALDEHWVLGRAMQVLYDHSVLNGKLLQGNLNKDEELHITISPQSLDDMTKIWSTFQDRPFRPSVCYVVTPVMIDSTQEMGVQRVLSKETDYAYMEAKKEEK